MSLTDNLAAVLNDVLDLYVTQSSPLDLFSFLLIHLAATEWIAENLSLRLE